MRRRSITGPIVLILVGLGFLFYNLRPDVPIFDLLSQYWPFLLILWGVLRLMEVMVDYFRGSLQRTSFSGGEVVLIIFVCLFGWGAFAAHSNGVHFRPVWEAFGEHYDFDVNAEKPAGDATRVVFENDRGNLHITGADTPDIKVTGRKTVQAANQTEASRANDATPVEIVVQGNQILVKTNQDHNPTSGRISEDLEITIPNRMSVEGHASYGDYDISELNGDVELHSGNAGVRLNHIGGNARVDLDRSDIIRAVDIKGKVDLSGKGSDIELENVAGQVTINGSYSGSLDFKNLAQPLHYESPNTDLRVAALPGQISMDLGELNANNLVGPVHLMTKSKDVKIEDFTDSLELETERGDIDLQPKHLPLPKIEARSKTGQIEITLPEKAGFHLVATAEHGEAVNEFGSAIQKKSEGNSSSLQGTVGQGPSIYLFTGHGTVTVRKNSGGDTQEPDKAEM